MAAVRKFSRSAMPVIALILIVSLCVLPGSAVGVDTEDSVNTAVFPYVDFYFFAESDTAIETENETFEKLITYIDAPSYSALRDSNSYSYVLENNDSVFDINGVELSWRYNLSVDASISSQYDSLGIAGVYTLNWDSGRAVDRVVCVVPEAFVPLDALYDSLVVSGCGTQCNVSVTGKLYYFIPGDGALYSLSLDRSVVIGANQNMSVVPESMIQFLGSAEGVPGNAICVLSNVRVELDWSSYGRVSDFFCYSLWRDGSQDAIYPSGGVPSVSWFSQRQQTINNALQTQFNDGYSQGSMDALESVSANRVVITDLLKWLPAAVSGIFDVNLFGTFGLSDVLGVLMSLALAFFVIKIFL